MGYIILVPGSFLHFKTAQGLHRDDQLAGDMGNGKLCLLALILSPQKTDKQNFTKRRSVY